ncbi:MAG: TonB-dependent receptor [Litorimonas sp.]
MDRLKFTKTVLVSASILAITVAGTASAQDTDQNQTANGADRDEIIVSGIRQALETALLQKRTATSLIEVIQAEDIGKLPDQNLAEVLENVTGVQITRTAGVGSGVQIRGTDANRTEINGVSTVGSGSGRSGINFEDVSAGIISAVEVIKAPTSKTIEGSVGGTINLRTIRPLEIDEDDTLASFRIQGEDSNLSTDGIKPRVSGTLGKHWVGTKGQEIGVVLSGSWNQQDVTAFRPRADRDNARIVNANVANPGTFATNFIPPQFFIQDYDNYEYETYNFAGSIEAKASEAVTLYFDAVVNNQERRQESSRVQASGISSQELSFGGIIDEFENVDFGSLNGQNIGTIDVAVRGIIPVEADGSDGNLRFSGDTGSRLTDSTILRFGTKLDFGRLTGQVEASSSKADSSFPSFNTTLNFINPNAPTNSSNENGTPFIYDLTGGSLTFGVAQDYLLGPSTAQLLDPANVVLRDVNIGLNETENSEDAFRIDGNYDLDGTFGTSGWSIDAGYRFSRTQTVRDEINSRVGLRSLADSPRGDQFADLLVAGPDNFGDADGRELFVRDFLLIDPDQVAADPIGVQRRLDALIAATGSTSSIGTPTSSQNAFFDIEEETHAFYGQANFDFGRIRGNAGLRYVDTNVASSGNRTLNGVTSLVTTEGNYDFFLPRFNIAADITDDIVVRGSYTKDIRRPNFDSLSTSFTFSTSPNPAVDLGNPNLTPEQVNSFDVSGDWYFAPAAVLSVGYFRKERTDVFSVLDENPTEDPTTGFRDISAPCEGGGIFNPIADINVFGPVPGVGVCVPLSTPINGAGETTQQGVEVALQYDLSDWEDRLGGFGWASGFGVIANYTYQDFSGNDEVFTPTTRAAQIFAGLGATNVELDQGAINLSKNAYNLTGYYEKYGISARLRYTWRDAFRSLDFGSTSSRPFGFPVVQEARGQLNASVRYDLNDHITFSVEGVNLTESDVVQSLVNEGGPLGFQGLTDRRVIFGASYTF